MCGAAVVLRAEAQPARAYNSAPGEPAKIRRFRDINKSRPEAALSYSGCASDAAALGLNLRGAFHPNPGALAGLLPAPNEVRTVLLLGFTGGAQWPAFASSDEARDGEPHPLDRWSRRLVDKLADDWGGIAIYPNDVPPWPFQQFATRGEPVRRSPIGLLIHERWGLWHAYRGAVILQEFLRIPEVRHGTHPCASCAIRPCLSTCPVGAFTSAGYDVGACLLHVKSAAGSDCREHGCRARRACPVGADHRYDDAQMSFHMAAFITAARSRE